MEVFKYYISLLVNEKTVAYPMGKFDKKGNLLNNGK